MNTRYEGTEIEMLKILYDDVARIAARYHEEFPDAKFRPALRMREEDGDMNFYLVLEPLEPHEVD